MYNYGGPSGPGQGNPQQRSPVRGRGTPVRGGGSPVDWNVGGGGGSSSWNAGPGPSPPPQQQGGDDGVYIPASRGRASMRGGMGPGPGRGMGHQQPPGQSLDPRVRQMYQQPGGGQQQTSPLLMDMAPQPGPRKSDDFNRNPPKPASVGKRSGGSMDCEIICCSRNLEEYAETIEDHVSQLNLKVDVMFINDESKIPALLDKLSSDGTIFAIVLFATNQERRSVTCHVLKGVPKPEVHRNMPLAVAYKLMKDRYTDLRAKTVGSVPDDTKRILLAMGKDEFFSAEDCMSVIASLHEYKKKLIVFENRGKGPIPDYDKAGIDALQSRILSVINDNSSPSLPPPSVLDNNVVQQALNNLQSTGFMKNILAGKP